MKPSLFLFLSLMTVSIQATPVNHFYVAPNGNDLWSGTRPVPNPRKTDGPFATLPHAVDAARDVARPVTIEVRDGTYFLAQPLLIGPKDSGLTLAAYRNEKPVISGGQRITGWRPATNQLWTAEATGDFRELWVNGQRRVRARYPNKGYLAVAEVLDFAPGGKWTEGQPRFRFREGDLKAWASVTNAEVVVMNLWVESRLPVVGVDEKERIITFSKHSVFQLSPGDLYWIENAFEALDAPGEWYLDRAAGRLYYWPMPGEDMGKAEVIAPVLAQVVRLENVEKVTFRGLTFAHTEWSLPKEASGFIQAAFGVPGAVFGDGARQCAFEDCRFSHVGSYALELARGCQSNRVVRCQMMDLGAGGVKIGEPVVREKEAEQAFGNMVTDCRVEDGGRMFPSGIGIWIGESSGNRLAHNLIHDFYYTGISIGWTWGYGASLAHDNIVEFNHVHHIGVRSDGDGPILSDMGGIYTLGKQPGTVIRNNLWHDIAGLRYGGWGIYFDEGTSDAVAENNLVYRTTHGGFHQHYGKDNIVRNNIFAFGRDCQIRRSRPEDHLSFSFEHNIVYWNQGALFEGDLNDNNFRFDSNLYFRTDGKPVTCAQWSWADWQKRGQDVHSLVADPLFAAPDRGDFKVRAGSPALGLGFKPFDLRDVGPRRE